MSAPLVLFDYEFSPFSQKVKLFLDGAGIPYQRVEQPIALPRPDLEKLDISYRRIPILAIGKDVYCDTDLIVDVILNQLGGSREIPTSVHDKAWQSWSVETFQDVLMLVSPGLLTEDFKEDRKTIFPILIRPDFASMRPSGLAEFRSRMSLLEDTVLVDGKGPFINGETKPSAADFHLIWPIKWGLFGLKAKDENGMGKETFPKVWRMIESLPKPTGKTIDGDQATKTVLDASYDPNVKHVAIEDDDPLNIRSGTEVGVESVEKASSLDQVGMKSLFNCRMVCACTSPGTDIL